MRHVPLMVAGLMLALFWFAPPPRAATTGTLEIASKTGVHSFSVEVVATDAEREKGLMYRRELPEGRGMLFDFQTEQPVAFWMKNTVIPLDMLFIGADGHIRRIVERTVPMSTTPISSVDPVHAVLEVNGGTAERLGIRPGDVVRHSSLGNGG